MKQLINKIFGRNKTESDNTPTQPKSLEVLESLNGSQENSVIPPQLIAACAQSVGIQREHNEDALFILTTTLSSDHTSLPAGLYLVADGMGGHQHGEIASGIAVRAMAGYIVSKLFVPLLSVKPIPAEESLQEIMQAGVQEAHRTITKQVPGSGTTLTAILILGEQATIAHVGDSRAYLIDSLGKLETLTRDHTLVKRLVELGQLSHEEAAVHPQRNVLYRALGQGEPFDPDIKTMSLPEKGYLLICSDGLWGVLTEEAISRLVKPSSPPEQICQALVDAANAAGGPDNITAILVKLPG